MRSVSKEMRKNPQIYPRNLSYKIYFYMKQKKRTKLRMKELTIVVYIYSLLAIPPFLGIFPKDYFLFFSLFSIHLSHHMVS